MAAGMQRSVGGGRLRIRMMSLGEGDQTALSAVKRQCNKGTDRNAGVEGVRKPSKRCYGGQQTEERENGGWKDMVLSRDDGCVVPEAQRSRWSGIRSLGKYVLGGCEWPKTRP